MANVLIQAKSSADRKDVVEVLADPHSGAIITAEIEHAQIHAGNGYSLSGKVATLANTATMQILARTGAIPVHWRAATMTVSDGDCDIYFYESPTITADGSLETSFNKNRLSTNTSTLDIYSTPTISANGTELEYGYIPDASGGGGGGGGRSSGGEAQRVGGEWILAPNTEYLVTVTNNSGGAISLGYTFFWYELG